MREVKHHFPITKLKERIGFFQIVTTDGFEAVELEYYLDRKYRNQGVMTKLLPEYLISLGKLGYRNIIAHVKKHNLASKKLLKKNGFKKLINIGNIEVFISILGQKLPDLKKFKRLTK